MSRVLPREGVVEGSAHLFPVRVYYEDTDAAGLVYYANYLRFAERARSEMLRRLGVEQERLRAETGRFFVVRRCAVDYRLPARLDDDLVVATRLAGLGAATLDLEQEVCRAGQTLVRLDLAIAAIGPSGRPQRLPPALRAALLSLNETTKMVTAHAR
ncbi:MAG TPA: tol-pal system-associated acyl-CoA thioesterase [Stellaceae bacterium]|nr:tol-pal system-associated acyl-CoA thioesterase [Stellaceae bacterium]